MSKKEERPILNKGEYKYDFLVWFLKTDYPFKLRYIIELFNYIDDAVDDELFTINDDFIWKKEDGDITLIKRYRNIGEPLLDFKTGIRLPANTLINQPNEIDTTIGRALANKILLEYPFGGKIPYINKKFTVGDIDSIIEKNMTDDKVDKAYKISPEEFYKYVDAVEYIDSFDQYLSVSATEKAVLPPPNLDKIKKEIVVKYIKKYGRKALEDITIVAMIERDLAKVDEEWLKDDVSYGKLISGKVKNIARKRLYLLFGVGNRFTDSSKVDAILDSLAKEGWDIDPKKLTNMINDSRAGSYSRGAETQQGGVVAKNTLRSTQDIIIVDRDCGSKVGLLTEITKSNYKLYIGRYILNSNKTPVLLDNDNINKYIGKKVELRSYMFCKAAPNFCPVCTGKQLEGRRNGISLLVSKFAGDLVNQSLSKFHGSSLDLVKLDKTIFT